jgi:DNA/RNA-binding domain of Phe-tRNA-synthetase-like protein
MWSKDEPLKKQILHGQHSNELKPKYEKYLDPNFDWNTLSIDEFKKLWDDWNIDSIKESNISKLNKLIEDIVRKQLFEEVNPISKVVTKYKQSINYISLKKKIQQMFYDFAKFSKEYNLDHKQMSEAFNKIIMDAKK